MRPFLFLASRDDDVAADGEYAAFLTYGRLTADQLTRVRMEAGPLPAIDLADYSGVIIGGSPFNSSDPAQSKSPLQRRIESELSGLLDQIVERDFPFLGACYGVGTLGAHQGAIIDDTYGEPVSPVTVCLTEAGRRDPLLERMPAEFEAFVGHKEAVRQLPPHATLLASSQTCPVQMFRIRQNLYATQFHPELDLDGILTRIHIYRHHGYFPVETAEEVAQTVRSRPVWAPSRILANFVARYAR